MKKSILLIATLFFFGKIIGQEQSAVFTHYHITPILVNPAHAGFDDLHALQMNIRSQWTGFPESPKSYHLSYNGPIGKTLGVGLGLMSENVGNRSNLRFQMNYAFRYNISKDFKFAAGFSTEFHTIRLADSVIDNPLYQQGDQIVEDAVDGNKIFDASLGFWGTIYERTHVGLSFQNLVVTRIGDIENGESEGSFLRYAILNFGHEFDIEPYNFKLQPSLMFQKIKDKDIQVDFNLKGSFIDDKLIAGVTYRTGLGDLVGIMLGTRIDVFQLYYSYDVGFQQIQQYNGGTHEVSIVFNVDGGKKKFDRSNGR